MITFACPKCGTSNLAHDLQAGQVMTCPNCGNSNVVPSREPVGGAVPQSTTADPEAPVRGSDARMWAVLCHVAAFAGFVIPFGNIAGPLVIWLVKGKTEPFVAAHGRESLNFQISITIYTFASVALAFVLVGFALLAALIIFEIIVVIKAAIAASDGLTYGYPLSIRFVK